MTRFGILLGVGCTLLVRVVLLLIYVVDPLLTITPDLNRLYSAPDSQPLYPIAFGWAILTLAVVWGACLLESIQYRTGFPRGALQILTRLAGALALIGGICVTSFGPSFSIGLGFILDAEDGGFYEGGGPELLVELVFGGAALLGAAVVVAIIAGILNRVQLRGTAK
jgi:hypothetical protein